MGRHRHAPLDGGFDDPCVGFEPRRLEPRTQRSRPGAERNPQRKRGSQPRGAPGDTSEDERVHPEKQRGLEADPASVGEKNPRRLGEDEERQQMAQSAHHGPGAAQS